MDSGWAALMHNFVFISINAEICLNMLQFLCQFDLLLISSIDGLSASSLKRKHRTSSVMVKTLTLNKRMRLSIAPMSKQRKEKKFFRPQNDYKYKSTDIREQKKINDAVSNAKNLYADRE